MRILLVLFVLTVPGPAFATTLTATASGTVRENSITADFTRMMTTDLVLTCEACPIQSWYTDQATSWLMTPDNQIHVTGGSNLDIFDGTVTGLTMGQILGGLGGYVPLTVDFTGLLNPALLGVSTDHVWSGVLNATLSENHLLFAGGPWSMSMTTQMPEPSTLALLAPGLALFWLWRRHVS